MQVSQQKEDVSISYISAICANCGVAYEIIRHDDNSTDGLVMKRIDIGDGVEVDAILRVQLKCTSSATQYSDKRNEIVYKLKVKNYNDLCKKSTAPAILCVLVLPDDEWVRWTEEDLSIKGCMYWVYLGNQQEKDNAATVSVHIDKSNIINEKTICDLLDKIAKEEWP